MSEETQQPTQPLTGTIAPEEEKDGQATYCPEDNKLRLYVGWLPRAEYERLRAEGWTATPKQNCDFVATWTPGRRDTALEYAGVIEDEDQGPDERAADRAERFAEYRAKRAGEATGHADRFEAGPSAHGFQNHARAERAAARHDRIAGRACDSWSKAEYWQRRTAGVISHALHVSSPAVRMGRIKELEADLRKREKSLSEYANLWSDFQKLNALEDGEKKTEIVRAYVGARSIWADYVHPRPDAVRAATLATGHPRAAELAELYATRKVSLYTLLTQDHEPITGAEACALFLSNHGEPLDETDWMRHIKLRLSYENQMLEAQGGRAAFVEMEAGGWLGSHQIQKVNKSPATGRVVSVTLKCQGNKWGRAEGPGWHLDTFNVERLPAGAYRAPTEEERAEFLGKKKAEKAAKGVQKSLLINPTDEDAERLQAVLNERGRLEHEEAKKQFRVHGDFKPVTVTRIKQATYSAASKGDHARAETTRISRNCELWDRYRHGAAREARAKRIGPAVAEVRTTYGGDGYYAPRSIIVITDKPQKPFPAELWTPAPPQTELALA